MLKPVRHLFSEALAGAPRRTRAQLAGLTAERPAGARSHITRRVRGQLSLIPLSDSWCLFAVQKDAAVHHGAHTDLIDESLTALEDEFGKEFVRVHRGELVALKHVESVRTDDTEQLRIRLHGHANEPVVSRRPAASFRQRLKSG